MSRKLLILILSVAAVGITSAVWSLRDEYDAARIATAHVAKQTCSCVHVSGRALDTCIAEIPTNEAQVAVSQEGAHVRASFLFGVASAEAAYEETYGCQLVS